jgi:hypothetical protein
VSLARLLAHYESAESSSRTLVPVAFCQELARSLRAEKITRRLYRLLSPDGVFSPAKDFPQTHFEAGNVLVLPPREVSGCKFVPADPARQAAMRRADAMAVLGEYVWQ